MFFAGVTSQARRTQSIFCGHRRRQSRRASQSDRVAPSRRLHRAQHLPRIPIQVVGREPLLKYACFAVEEEGGCQVH